MWLNNIGFSGLQLVLIVFTEQIFPYASLMLMHSSLKAVHKTSLLYGPWLQKGWAPLMYTIQVPEEVRYRLDTGISPYK